MTRRVVVGLWCAVALIGAVGMGAHRAGYRINTSISMPRGLWRLERTPGPLLRGAAVAICPPDTPLFRAVRERGYIPPGECPGGYEPVFKRVGAVAGDVVIATTEGVIVNGEPVPRSARLTTDSNSRPVPHLVEGRYVVPAGYVWVLSGTNPRSFDSRYFGGIPISCVRGRITPVWVFE